MHHPAPLTSAALLLAVLAAPLRAEDTPPAPPKDAPAKEKESKRPGLFDLLKDLANSKAGQSAADAVLSNDEVRAGLKEALSKGIRNAIGTLGREDGFFKNEAVKILVPGELRKMEDGARLVGQGKRVDEFVETLNRAAEQATPHVADVFADAISKLTVADAQAILHGPENAATEYFKNSSRETLYEKILPLVREKTEKNNVTGEYKKLSKKAGPLLQLVTKKDPDLDAYVTNRTLDGLFTVLATEEKQIRTNPAARTTSLLQRVFGSRKEPRKP